MSSNIRVQRICINCRKQFTAKKTTTKYCSLRCASKAYKANKRNQKIESTNKETSLIIGEGIESIKQKEFLTARDVAKLLDCSVRTVYYLISQGKIDAINIGERMTRVKRSALDKLFQESKPLDHTEQEPQVNFEQKDCYTIQNIMQKYKVSQSTLRQILIKHKPPKVRKGRYTFVPKKIIDNIFKSWL